MKTRFWIQLPACCVAAAAAVAAMPATQTKPGPATRPCIVLQADAAEQHGTLFATTRPGYTGAAYVTGIDGDDDRLTWHAKAEQGGVYQVEIRYSTPDLKGYDLAVNGVSNTGTFQPTGDAFATQAAGKAKLTAGDNVIEMRRGWGHYDVDRVELIPTELPELKVPPATLCDPDATPATRQLMQKLIDGYGKTTPAGVNGLWRPLHEADGGWFWWGAKGPDSFKALWSILYDRLTNHHKLHNLIWVYTATTKWDWYPPEKQFDVVGVDV